MTARGQSYLIAIGLAAAALAPSPARAKPTSPDTEAGISAALAVDTGLVLARQQAAGNDMPGAVATLERVLIGHPDAIVPRLLYANLLCRLDDPKGAAAELALLGSESVADEDWAEVTQSCGEMPRPGTGEARP